MQNALLMKRFQHGGTQPFKTLAIFNNWDVVTHGWYLVAKQSAARKAQVRRTRNHFTLQGTNALPQLSAKPYLQR